MVLFLVLAAALPCGPSAALREKLDQLDEFDAREAPRGAHKQAVLAQVEAIAREHQEAEAYEAWVDYTRQYARERLKTMSQDSLLGRYAAALAEPKKLEALAKEAPELVAAWRGLARSRDATQAKVAYDKVRASCPTHPWTLSHAAKFYPAAYGQWLKGWRTAIEKLADREAADALPALWKLEIAASGGKGLEEHKARVGRDAARFSGDRLFVLALRYDAAEITGADKAELADKLLRLYPYSRHGWKAMGLLAKNVSAVLVAKYPKVDGLVDARFDVLADRESASAAEKREIAALGARKVEAWREDGAEDASALLEVARTYLRHGVELRSLPKLLDDAASAMSRPQTSDGVPEEMKGWIEKARLERKRQLALLRLELAEQNDDWTGAKRLLADYEQLAPREKDKDPDAAVARSKLMRRDGNFGDALALLVRVEPTAAAKQELRSLWADLGGSAQSLESLVSRPKADEGAAEHWTAVGKALPDFSLKDTTGKTWNKKALAGKRVFVSVWASWCGPCKQELPELAELAKVGQASGLTVLALNVDDNPADAAAFLATNKVAVPVILQGQALADAVTGYKAIPRSWVVDRGGVVVHEMVGFRPVAEWGKRTLAQIEALLAK